MAGLPLPVRLRRQRHPHEQIDRRDDLGPGHQGPIDATFSTVDHFVPGIGVDCSTSGGGARIGLTYYFYPAAACSSTTLKSGQ